MVLGLSMPGWLRQFHEHKIPENAECVWCGAWAQAKVLMDAQLAEGEHDIVLGRYDLKIVYTCNRHRWQSEEQAQKLRHAQMLRLAF